MGDFRSHMFTSPWIPWDLDSSEGKAASVLCVLTKYLEVPSDPAPFLQGDDRAKEHSPKALFSIISQISLQRFQLRA